MPDTDSWLPPLRAGRQPAGRALLGWLADPQSPRVCRVAGSAGSGKSHLVGWLATACVGRPGLVALSLAGLTVESATWLLGARLGVLANTPDELVAGMRDDDRPRLLMLWDLNRADAPAPIAELVLAPLLALPYVRAVLEAAEDTPEPVPHPAVLDLDQPEWTSPAKFARWYGQLGTGSPFPAEALRGHPGSARLAARVPAGADPSGGVAAAWWAAVPEEVRPALRALAAAPRPLSSEEWALLAEPAAVARASELLPPDSAAEGSWWLPPGELRAVVTAGAPEPDRHAVVRALAEGLPHAADGGIDPPRADAERLGLLLRESVRSGAAAQLLEDPRILAHADPVEVSTALAACPDSRFGRVWRAAGPALAALRDGAARAAVLRTRLLGTDEEAAAALDVPGAWRAEWAVWLPPAAPRLRAGALTQGPYAGYVMLVDAGGAVRAANLTNGQVMDVPALPAPGQPRSLTALPDGSVVALDGRGQAQLLAGPALPPLPEASEAELSVLGPAGAVGDVTGRVRWLPTGAAERLHAGPVTALGGAVLADDPAPTLVSGGLDGCVRVWTPGAPRQEQPVDQRDCAVVAAALRQSPQGLLAATGWADGLVRIYLLEHMGESVQVRLGSAVLSVLIDGAGRVVVVLPDGVVCLTLGPEPPQLHDLSDTPGFLFSPDHPSAHLQAVPRTPALPGEVLAEARRRPGQWLYGIDPRYLSDGRVPGHSLTGCWQIGQHGEILRFLANPLYRPPGYREPQNTAEAVVQRATLGRCSADLLALTLADAELLVRTTEPGGVQLSLRPGPDGGDVVEACTSPDLVPQHWPGTMVLTGRKLSVLREDVQTVQVNPDTEASVSVPLSALAA